MKHLFLVAVLGCSAPLAACTTTDYSYQARQVDISEPPLAATVTVNVGDTMLRQGKYAEQDAIKLDRVVKIGGFGYTLTPGTFVKKGQSKDGSFYLPSGALGSGDIQKSILADPYQSVLLKNDNATICVVTIFNLRACEKNVRVAQIKEPTYSENSFQQTLIYLGRVGDKINVGYREFSSNTARPAFNNEVEYDLKASEVIAYKGARLRIVEATNERIKFTVISNFNTAQP